MKKHLSKITSLVLSLVIIFSGIFSIFVSADTTEELSYTERNPSIITPDSFYDKFGTDTIDRINYDYQIVMTSENSKSIVVFYFEIIVDDKEYYSAATGNIIAHQLPSGDILWEGALDGSMIVNDEYTVSIYFVQLSSTGQTMISATLDNGVSPYIVFSFGDNIMTGEVSEFYSNMVSNQSTIDSMVMTDDFCDFGNSDIMVVNPGFSVIEDPADGGGSANLGANGEYKLQFHSKIKHSTAYNALETNVYFYQARGEVLITTKPFISDTDSFYKIQRGSQTTSTIHSVNIHLGLDSNTTDDKFAIVGNTYFPHFAGVTNSSEEINDRELFVALLMDFLSLFSIPTNTIQTILTNEINRFNTSISVTDDAYNANVSIDSFYDASVIEETSSGLAFRVFLLRPRPENYVGDTPCNVTVTVRYVVTTPGFPPYIESKQASTTMELDL